MGVPDAFCVFDVANSPIVSVTTFQRGVLTHKVIFDLFERGFWKADVRIASLELSFEINVIVLCIIKGRIVCAISELDERYFGIPVFVIFIHVIPE